MPFSPRWLVHQDRESEARKVLSMLRGIPQESELIEIEFLEIKAQSLFEKRTVAESFPHLQDMTTLNIFKLYVDCFLNVGEYLLSVLKAIRCCRQPFQDEANVSASYCRNGDHVLPTMDRYVLSCPKFYTRLLIIPKV